MAVASRSGKPVPPLPSEPGCYLWLHHGCPRHPELLFSGWRSHGDGADSAEACERIKSGFDRLCGTTGTLFHFVSQELPPQQAEPQLASAPAPVAPGELLEKARTAADSLEAIETEAGGMLLGAAGLPTPELPRVPGCFLWVHHGCPLRPHAEYVKAWYEDAEGAASRHLCELRRDRNDEFCGRSNTTMYFLPGKSATPSMTEDAPLPAVPPPAAQPAGEPARVEAQSAPARAPSGTPTQEAPGDARQQSRLRTPAPAVAAQPDGFRPAKAVEKAKLAAGQAAGAVQQAAVSFVSRLSSALPWTRTEAAPAGTSPLAAHPLQPLRMKQQEQQQ